MKQFKKIAVSEIQNFNVIEKEEQLGLKGGMNATEETWWNIIHNSNVNPQYGYWAGFSVYNYCASNAYHPVVYDNCQYDAASGMIGKISIDITPGGTVFECAGKNVGYEITRCTSSELICYSDGPLTRVS